MRNALCQLRAHPFDVFREFDRFLGREPGGDDQPQAAYPVDIHENDDALVVEAELPGFTRDQIAVSVDDGVLTIEGKRDEQTDGKGEKHLHERRYAHVARHFRVPAAFDTTAVEATLDHGVLTLTLPKKEDVKPRKIEVK